MLQAETHKAHAVGRDPRCRSRPTRPTLQAEPHAQTETHAPTETHEVEIDETQAQMRWRWQKTVVMAERGESREQRKRKKSAEMREMGKKNLK